MKKNILITGGSGLFAVNCARALHEHFSVYLLQNKKVVKVPGAYNFQCEISNSNNFNTILTEINPFALIHAAGLTDVDFCEKNPNEAYHANSELSSIVAKACAEINCKMVYLSTDHIFDVDNSNATEISKPNPINIYAKSKLKGELFIKKNCENALIIRSNFFGWGTTYRLSFSDFLFQHLSQNKEVFLYDNIFTHLFF